MRSIKPKIDLRLNIDGKNIESWSIKNWTMTDRNLNCTQIFKTETIKIPRFEYSKFSIKKGMKAKITYQDRGHFYYVNNVLEKNNFLEIELKNVFLTLKDKGFYIKDSAGYKLRDFITNAPNTPITLNYLIRDLINIAMEERSATGVNFDLYNLKAIKINEFGETEEGNLLRMFELEMYEKWAIKENGELVSCWDVLQAIQKIFNFVIIFNFREWEVKGLPHIFTSLNMGINENGYLITGAGKDVSYLFKPAIYKRLINPLLYNTTPFYLDKKEVITNLVKLEEIKEGERLYFKYDFNEIENTTLELPKGSNLRNNSSSFHPQSTDIPKPIKSDSGIVAKGWYSVYKSFYYIQDVNYLTTKSYNSYGYDKINYITKDEGSFIPFEEIEALRKVVISQSNWIDVEVNYPLLRLGGTKNAL